MSDLSPESIIQVASGYMAAKELLVAVEIGLFETLAEGAATIDELGQRTNRLEEAVRTDRIIFGESGFTEEERLYSAGVEAVTAGTAKALARTYDFAPHRRLLDLGGGTGSFLLPILARYQNLECTLYDLPEVAAATRQRMASDPVAARIHVIAADFFKDSIPEGYDDAVIIANIVHCFAADRVMHLLRRVREHVAAKARILLVDFWTDPTHTQPVFAALMVSEFLLTPGGGDVYSVDEAQQWLHDTGWKAVVHKPLVGPASLIVAEAGD
jgi:O-methyltransferase domain